MVSFLQPNQRLSSRLVSKTWYHAADPLPLCITECTVLRQHCKDGCFNAIRFVIQRGCVVKYEDYMGYVIHPSDNPKIMEYLLTHGGKQFLKWNWSEGYLNAVNAGNIRVVDHVITNYTDVRYLFGEDLMIACAEGHIEMAAHILSINNVIETSNGDVMYYTCKLGRLRTLRWLVKNGIDLDKWGPFGVETACHFNHRDLAFYLFSRGVSPSDCSLLEYTQSPDTVDWMRNQGVPLPQGSTLDGVLNQPPRFPLE